MLAIVLRACLCLLFFLCAMCSAAIAYEDAYLPLDKKLLSKRVKQRLVCDPLQAGMGSVRWSGKCKMEISGENLLLINGSDNAGKPWSFVAGAWRGCASIWAADLDNNGMDDLIIAMRTTDGAKTPTQLIILMVERNGRPFPWATDGYFDVDNKGIKDFVDMDNDGKAELIRQSQDDGYWITSAYEASRARWQRLNCTESISLPLYTRHTFRENKTSIRPPKFRHPFDADLSNDCIAPQHNKNRQYIEAVEFSPNVGHNKTPCFLLSDGRRIRPQYWHASMCAVIDEPAGRKMALLSEPNAVHKITNEIAWRHIPISISGSRTKPGQRNLTSELIFGKSTSRRFASRPEYHTGRNLDLAAGLDSSLP